MSIQYCFWVALDPSYVTSRLPERPDSCVDSPRFSTWLPISRLRHPGPRTSSILDEYEQRGGVRDFAVMTNFTHQCLNLIIKYTCMRTNEGLGPISKCIYLHIKAPSRSNPRSHYKVYPATRHVVGRIRDDLQNRSDHQVAGSILRTHNSFLQVISGETAKQATMTKYLKKGKEDSS